MKTTINGLTDDTVYYSCAHPGVKAGTFISPVSQAEADELARLLSESIQPTPNPHDPTH